MPRRRVAEKREQFPDPKYGSKLLSKFVNAIMEGGKKVRDIKLEEEWRRIERL